MKVILSREARNGYGSELDMDKFVYNYLTINGAKSNRLDYVRDLGTDYASYNDIKSGQTSGNYRYNQLGELTRDLQEGMILHWRYGDHKLQRIERTDQDSPEVEFIYNPLGVRVGKLVKPRQNGQLQSINNWTMYYYVYAMPRACRGDANSLSRCMFPRFLLENRRKTTNGSQLMAVYDSKIYSSTRETVLSEQYIYGSERVGVIQQGLTVFENGVIQPSTAPLVEHTLGQKRYELKNHLGTVNVTISDRKTYNSLEDAFEATVTNYAETYPFGMLSDTCFLNNKKLSRTNPDENSSGVMPNRSFNADGQRHLYHGMEQDVEVSGSGNSYTTEFRQYSLSRCMFSRFYLENRSKTTNGNPRLGRWKSLDALMHMFPHLSPYVGFDNNPIYFVDPYGLSSEVHYGGDGGGEPEDKKGIFKGDDGKGKHFTGTSNPKGSVFNTSRGKEMADKGDLYTNTETGEVSEYQGRKEGGWKIIEGKTQELDEVTVTAPSGSRKAPSGSSPLNNFDRNPIMYLDEAMAGFQAHTNNLSKKGGYLVYSHAKTGKGLYHKPNARGLNNLKGSFVNVNTGLKFTGPIVGLAFEIPEVVGGYNTSLHEGNKQVVGAAGTIGGGWFGGAVAGGTAGFFGATTGPGVIITVFIGAGVGGFIGEEAAEDVFEKVSSPIVRDALIDFYFGW